jgi:hypothetical protein
MNYEGVRSRSKLLKVVEQIFFLILKIVEAAKASNQGQYILVAAY